MKLFYSPGACSLSPHIALREAGLAFEPVLASTKTHKLPDGSDFYGTNPLGYVPLLELDDGTRLRNTSPTSSPSGTSRPPTARCRATACRNG
jgi:glutathione S-transferase